MIKTFVVLLIMAALVAGCGKDEGPQDPDGDEHNQGKIMSYNNSDILRRSAGAMISSSAPDRGYLFHKLNKNNGAFLPAEKG